MRRSALAIAATLGALGTANASAQTIDEVDPEVLNGDDRVTLVLGAVTVPSYEGSDDNLVVPVPAVFGKIGGFGFYTRGTQLVTDVIPDASANGLDFQFGPVVGVNLNRTGRIVDDRVEALGKRKVAAEVGAHVGLAKTGVITSDYDTLSLDVSYVHDAGGVHRSYVVSAGVTYSTPLSPKLLVLVSLDASYAGRGYAQTYFGVDGPGALRSGLPAFSPRAGWKNYSVSALATYSLSTDLRKGWALLAGASYGRLLNDFAASPVTSVAGTANQWIGGAGLAYTF